jgi:hypothetical protein
MPKLVTVACKLPNGITLDHADKKVTLKGANADDALLGYGRTPVDADWFDSWLSNKEGGGHGCDFPAVKNGLIFASADAKKVDDEIAEKAGDETVRTGLEPIDPDKPGVGLEKVDEKNKK